MKKYCIRAATATQVPCKESINQNLSMLSHYHLLNQEATYSFAYQTCTHFSWCQDAGVQLATARCRHFLRAKAGNRGLGVCTYCMLTEQIWVTVLQMKSTNLESPLTLSSVALIPARKITCPAPRELARLILIWDSGWWTSLVKKVIKNVNTRYKNKE